MEIRATKDTKELLMITHKEDLDGISCSILFKQMCDLQKQYNTVFYEDYHSVNTTLQRIFSTDECKKYHTIIITDLCISPATAKIIDNKIRTGGVKVILLDHHDTNDFLNDFAWAVVKSFDVDKNKICATKLYFQTFYDVFKNTKFIKPLVEFVEAVNSYDTFTWINNPHSYLPKKLHNLFAFFGIDKFISEMYNNLFYRGVVLSDEHNSLLSTLQDKEDQYIADTLPKVEIIRIGGHNVGVVMSERKEYVSMLGRAICSSISDVDIAAIIDLYNNKISYRSISDKIHLGRDFASKFGGGGHDKAAGSEIDSKLKQIFIQKLFNWEE